MSKPDIDNSPEKEPDVVVAPEKEEEEEEIAVPPTKEKDDAIEEGKTDEAKTEEAKTEEKEDDKKKEGDGDAKKTPTTEEALVSLKPRSFSDAFYCPITKSLMVDPVVTPDGDSYERSAIVARGDVQPDKMYPNRALTSILEERKEKKGSSFHASLRRMQQSMKKSMKRVMEKSPLPADLPEAYYCPITFGIIHEPVIDKEGNTFEKVAIENWIRVNSNSPITRTELEVEDLFPNNALAALLQEEKECPEDAMHPSIRKWKDEKPPELADEEMGGNLPTTHAQIQEIASAQRGDQRLGWLVMCSACLCFFYVFGFGVGLVVITCALLCFICSEDRDGDDDDAN